MSIGVFWVGGWFFGGVVGVVGWCVIGIFGSSGSAEVVGCLLGFNQHEVVMNGKR